MTVYPRNRFLSGSVELRQVKCAHSDHLPPIKPGKSNHPVVGRSVTGERARVIFGETLCLPARSRFGEGRAAPSPA